MKVGDRLNVYVVGEGNVPYRAKVASVLHSLKYGPIPAAVQVVRADGEVMPLLLQLGSFVVIHDQTAPDWEAAK